MGFTEAEIGFVIAALFAAMAVASFDDLRETINTVDSLKIELADTQRERDTTAAALQSAEAELAVLRKKSTKRPQCWEMGESREAVADIAVLGANQFEVNGRVLNEVGVAALLADKIAIGNKLGCNFVLRARPTPGVDAGAHSDAVWRLRRLFDVNDRPR